MEQTACKCTPGEFQAIPAQSMSCKQRLHGMHAFPTTWRPQAAQNDKGSVQDSHQFVTGTGVRAPAARLAVQHDAVLGRAADDAHALARRVELQDVEHLVRRVGAALAHEHRRAGARVEDKAERARGRHQRRLVGRLCLVRHALRALRACARCSQCVNVSEKVCCHMSICSYVQTYVHQGCAAGGPGEALWEDAPGHAGKRSGVLGGKVPMAPCKCRHMQDMQCSGATVRLAPRDARRARATLRARRAVRDDRVADRERAEELAQQLRPRLAPPGAAHQPRVAEVEALGRAWGRRSGRRRVPAPGGPRRAGRAPAAGGGRRAGAGRPGAAGLWARARGSGGRAARGRGRAACTASGRALRLGRALAVGHAADAALQPAQRAQLGRARDGLWTKGACAAHRSRRGTAVSASEWQAARAGTGEGRRWPSP